MEYKVGSLANMISGSPSVNKPKLSKKQKVNKGMKVKFEKVKAPVQEPSTTKIGQKKKRKLGVDIDSPKEKRLRFSDPLELGLSVGSKKKGKNVESKKGVAIKDRPSSKNTVHVLDQEQESRTIFVGNVPKTMTKQNLKGMFLKYGRMETIRIRSASVANPRLSQKAAVITGNLHPKRTNINAYIRFKDGESAHKALVENGTVINAHTLRVDLAIPGDSFDTKKSIFIGNLNFEIEEEALRNTFKSCGNIISIRLVRDKKTGMGKGIAYINFESLDAVELALKLDGEVLAKRPMRVGRSLGSKSKGKKAKGQGSFEETAQKKKKKKTVANEPNTKENKSAISEFQGEKTDKKKLKKRKGQSKDELKKKIMQSKLEIKPKLNGRKMKLVPAMQN